MSSPSTAFLEVFPGHPDGCPGSGFQHRCRPTMAPCWPHPRGRSSSWQKLIDHLLLFIQHSSHTQFIIDRNMVFYMPGSTFLCDTAPSCGSELKVLFTAISDHLVALSFTHSISGFDWPTTHPRARAPNILGLTKTEATK